MGALIACLSVAAALIAMLLAVLAAGSRYDRQQQAEINNRAVLAEAEGIVRSAAQRLRPEAGRRTNDDAGT